MQYEEPRPEQAEHEHDEPDTVTESSKLMATHLWPPSPSLLRSWVPRSDASAALALAERPLQALVDVHLEQEVVWWTPLLEQLELRHDEFQKLLVRAWLRPAKLITSHLEKAKTLIPVRVLARAFRA